MIESLRDLNYGSVVIKNSLSHAIWHWFKYVLGIGMCGLVIGISSLTYFTPQIPKFLQERFPVLPYTWDDGRVSVFLDENKLILNDRKGQSNEIKFSDIKKDFKLDKNSIVKWTEGNKSWLLGAGLAILLSLELIMGGFYLLWQAVAFLLFAVGFWIFGKIIKKNITFRDTLKIVIYAGVLPLLISTLNILFQDKILDMLSFGLFVFYAGAWIYHLQDSIK